VNHLASPQQSAPRKVHPQQSGLEHYLAGLNASVGDETSTLEDLMVEIRVAVADADGAHGLLRRLAGLFGRSSVSFDVMRNEVRVHSEWESRSVVQVISAVESWLAADGIDSAKLSVGDRSYTMAGPAIAVGRAE
jgi:hypothetical protein